MPHLFSLLHRSLYFLHTPPPCKDTARKSSCIHVCSVAKLCLTLCDPMAWSLPDSSVHGISQARVLEWVDIPPPGDLPNPGIEPESPALAGRFFIIEPPGKPSKKADIYEPRRCLPRTQPHWHLDPGHPSLQNCEREMSNVCCLSPRSFVGSLK